MIQKINSSEYLKRLDSMTAAEKEEYTKRVGEWLGYQAMFLSPKAGKIEAQFQNVIQCSASWNDNVCKAWNDGARLLTALMSVADTWLPDMLYVKSAKRAIRQMHCALSTVVEADSAKEAPANTDTGAKEDPAEGKAAIKREQNGTGSDSAEREQARPEVNPTQDVAPFQDGAGDGSVAGGNNEGEVQVTLTPARPKHIDQYIHLLPKKTQEHAELVQGLYRELEEARQKMNLLMDDATASPADREAWAKKATKCDNALRKIFDELDAEWAKLVKSGRVVVDDLGNARVLPAADTEEAQPVELTPEQKARRRDLRKWLVDTRRGNGDTREEYVKKWEANFREYLALEGDAAFEDEKVMAAMKHYGIDGDSLKAKDKE